MKKKLTVSRLAAILAVIITMTAISGCGSSKDKENAQESAAVQESSSVQESTSGNQEEPAREEPKEEKEPETAPVSEAPEPAQETPAEPEPEPVQPPEPAAEQPSAQNPEQEIPQDLWPDGKFALNGVPYQLPIPQQTLADAGWTIRFENTRNTEAFKMQPGEVMKAELSLAGYENAIVVTAEFENMGTEAVLLNECPLTAFYISAAQDAQLMKEAGAAGSEGEETAAAAEQAAETAEKLDAVYLPLLEISSNITWGSSAEEITAAYGEPTFSGSGSTRFDCMYENKYFYLEFLGEPDKGMRQMIYCVN